MIDVKETLNSAAERMEMAAMYLAEELSHVRAGRANVAISIRSAAEFKVSLTSIIIISIYNLQFIVYRAF